MQMNFAEWWDVAQQYLIDNIPPAHTAWGTSQQLDLFSCPSATEPRPVQFHKIDPKFIEYARSVVCHRNPQRFGILYDVLWRCTHGEPNLVHIDVDPIMQSIHAMRKAVRRDLHKMKAFVRFKEIMVNDEPTYVAWYEPDHYILEACSGFFVRRFGNMRWTIATPYQCLLWNKHRLYTSEGLKRKPEYTDAFDELWCTYYASIFNPARVNVSAMKNEMPVRFWKNLPEARVIPTLLAQAEARVLQMRKTSD